MCTILIARDHFAAAPLVVAANRDELYARPTEAGSCIEPGIVGGIDLERRGTWMGLNRHGLLVALTNLGPFEAGRRSRGQLVLEMLRRTDVESARGALEDEALDAFTPFNLVVADKRRGFTVHAPPGGATIAPIPTGLSVVVSGGPPDDERQPKVERVRQLAANIPPDLGSEPLRDALLKLLADRAPAPPSAVAGWRAEVVGERGSDLGFVSTFAQDLQRVWVRTPVYGTRSSSVALLGDQPRYWYVDGDPDGGPVGQPTALDSLLTTG